MRHLKIFENFDDIDPMARDIFDAWDYINITNDGIRLRGTGENSERAHQLAKDINFGLGHFMRVKFAREGDDELTEEEISLYVNRREHLKKVLEDIGYVMVNKSGTILAPLP